MADTIRRNVKPWLPSMCADGRIRKMQLARANHDLAKLTSRTACDSLLTDSSERVTEAAKRREQHS